MIIEKGIPIPPSARAGRRPVYPLADMEVGDSFIIPEVADRKRAAASVTRMARRVGIRVTTRPEGDGLRVWRVAAKAAANNPGLTD